MWSRIAGGAIGKAPIPPVAYKHYGVRIDQSNSNPETCCTYIGDSVGLKPKEFQGSWRETPIFKSIKPCILKNGKVVYYLQKDKINLKEDGSPAKLDGTDGDVMVEVPKIGYNFKTIDDDVFEIWVTNKPDETDFCYRAHSLNKENDCDKIYYGAFLGSDVGGQLHSYANKNPVTSITLDDGRSTAQKLGNGYQQFSIYPLNLLQCLYLLQYKNLNSQLALGRGYADASSKDITGTTVSQPENFGTQNARSDHMKFLNIEDLWGNLRVWVDGYYNDSNYSVHTAYNNFNDTGADYPYFTRSGISNVIDGYISRVQGNNELGFTIIQNKGTATTYFSDYSSFEPSYVPVYGGHWSYNANSGVFYLGVNYSPTSWSSNIGARLMYKHIAE